jgi:hypothetical protein
LALAAEAALLLLLCCRHHRVAAAVAIKTPAVTAMVGAQKTINNQLQLVVVMVTAMARMIVTTTTMKTKAMVALAVAAAQLQQCQCGNNGGGRAGVRKQRGGGRGSAAVAVAVCWWRQQHGRGRDGRDSAAAAVAGGDSTQASKVNYVSLYTQLPTNQFVHVAPWLIILVTTSSNAHASAKLEFTIQFTMALHKLLSQFYLPLDMSPQTLQWDMEPILYLPSNPHSCPFNLAFDPYSALPPLTSHSCTSTTVGTDITISSLPTKLSIIPSSPDVLQIITANDDSHLQKGKCRKLGRINKTDTSTSIITWGDTLIGDLLHRNMLLIPFAIDPLGRFGPLLQHFLFGRHPAPLLWFPPSRPNATQMYTQLLQYPSPKGILLLANHIWLLHPTQHLYGNSYLAPTPSIITVQSLGVSLTEAFTHHI